MSRDPRDFDKDSIPEGVETEPVEFVNFTMGGDPEGLTPEQKAYVDAWRQELTSLVKETEARVRAELEGPSGPPDSAN